MNQPDGLDQPEPLSILYHQNFDVSESPQFPYVLSQSVESG